MCSAAVAGSMPISPSGATPGGQLRTLIKLAGNGRSTRSAGKVNKNMRRWALPGLVLSSFGILVSAWADTKAEFALPSGVTVSITEGAFVADQFKIEGCSGKSPQCRIDGKVPFGVDGGIPRTYVKSIEVAYRGQTYHLDSSNMYDSWGGRPLMHEGLVRYFGGRCDAPGFCQFRGLFSDAAGAFVAEWKIRSGVPMRTVLTDSNDVIHLFLHNMDPPEID
jgi:hypothetical protein